MELESFNQIGLDSNLDEFADMIQLLEQDANAKLTDAYIDNGFIDRVFLKYTGDEDVNELMLRLNAKQHKLVVARIGFIHQRQGYGEQLLNLLIQYGKRNGYKELMFEAVTTESMRNFAKKHGFKLASELKYESNWVKEI